MRKRKINKETGEEKIFNFNLFNSETDPFPYQEATFDVVLFCEILEIPGIERKQLKLIIKKFVYNFEQLLRKGEIPL